jgi:hypothetical protein
MSAYSISTLTNDSDEILLDKREKMAAYQETIDNILQRRALERVRVAVTSLETQSSLLITETGNVRSAVEKLATSSGTLEKLTIKLNCLTLVCKRPVKAVLT